MELAKGARLPYFRLATLGGVSTSRDDLEGRPALFFGWASWDASRDALPLLEQWYARNRAAIELVTIAFDVQGVDPPMRYLKAARFTHTALIDATCELSRVWGVKQVPFAVVADAAGVVRLTGDTADEPFLAQALASLPKKPEAPPPDPKQEHAFVRFEFLLQSCTNLLTRARKEDALAALQQAMDCDPQSFLVRKQMWAIAHPERFYKGAIDFAWQKTQEDATRSVRQVRKR
jgi:hypothetical protein